MRRHADRQHDGASRTGRFGLADGDRNRRRVTGDNDLTGCVEVDGLGHPFAGGLRADLTDHIVFKPDNRGHCAFAERHRRLHQFGAPLDDPYGVGKVNGARTHQGRVFTETMAGHM